MKSFITYFSLLSSLVIFLETSHAFDAAVFFVLFGVVPVSHTVIPAHIMLAMFAGIFGIICTATLYILLIKQKSLVTFRQSQTA